MMAIALAKNAIDVGVVTTNGEKALGFYRDLLGLEPDGEVPFPGIGVINRFKCGDSTLKVLVLENDPAGVLAPGGFIAAPGIRYLTLTCSNLEEVIADCKAAGHNVPVDVRELKPGVKVAMVEDPDGNTVEICPSAKSLT